MMHLETFSVILITQNHFVVKSICFPGVAKQRFKTLRALVSISFWSLQNKRPLDVLQLKLSLAFLKKRDKNFYGKLRFPDNK